MLLWDKKESRKSTGTAILSNEDVDAGHTATAWTNESTVKKSAPPWLLTDVDESMLKSSCTLCVSTSMHMLQVGQQSKKIKGCQIQKESVLIKPVKWLLRRLILTTYTMPAFKMTAFQTIHSPIYGPRHVNAWDGIFPDTTSDSYRYQQESHPHYPSKTTIHHLKQWAIIGIWRWRGRYRYSRV